MTRKRRIFTRRGELSVFFRNFRIIRGQIVLLRNISYLEE